MQRSSTLKEEGTLVNSHIDYWRNKNLRLEYRDAFLSLFKLQNRSESSDLTTLQIFISDESSARILKACNNSELSLYILMVALFKSFVSICNGDSLVTTISPHYIANEITTEQDYLIIQDKISISSELKDIVHEVRKTLIGAYTNQDYFKADYVSNITGPRDFMKIIEGNFLCLNESIHKINDVSGRFPWVFHFNRIGENVSASVRINKAEICESLAEKFCIYFSYFIGNASADFRKRVNEVPLISESEMAVLDDFSHGNYTSLPDFPLHLYFENQASKQPSQRALIYGDEILSYDQLNKSANRVGRRLRSLGVNPGDHVGLLFTRSVEMIVSILAVLKVGAAFIPINPNDPKERLNYYFKESSPVLLLSNLELSLPDLSVKILRIDKYDIFENENDINLDLKIDRRSVAYIIFTSGTTGTPKGVVIEHLGIANASIWRAKQYRLSNLDRVLLLFSYNFDGFLLNLFSPLLSGATIVLVKEEDAKNPAKISEYIDQYCITHLTTIPQLFHFILEQSSLKQLKTLQWVTLAADVTELKTIQLANKLNPQLRISNEYGPTENSVVSTFLERMEIDTVNVIGRPVDNVSVFILRHDMTKLPVGMFGELYLGGAGLAIGYLNDIALTENTFIEWEGKRLFKTGDVGRWLPNGAIEFKGRISEEIKIRGYRIGLDEIKNSVLSYPGVSEALILIVGEGTKDSLCACVTTTGKVELQDLRQHIVERLPDYMVPQQYIFLPSFPVNDSGKYDLPAINGYISQNRYSSKNIAPATDTENKLALLWQKILHVEEIGVEENFFALGGHSLKATALLSDIYNVFEVELSLTQIFTTSTIRGLATAIDSFRENHSEKVVRLSNREYYVLSSAQERLIALSTIESLGQSYNIPIIYLLIGRINLIRLQKALNTLVNRHELLRTYFPIINGHLVQVIDKYRSVTILEKEIDSLDIDKEIENISSTFRLDDLPLFRVALLKTIDKKNILVFDFHHIIIDESSLDLFFAELVKIYNGEILSELSLSYKDYAAWQRQRLSSDEYNIQMNYWLRKFVSREFRPLELPYDYERPARMGYRGARVERTISTKCVESVKEICKKHECTSFMFFLAAFNILLNRFTNQNEIIIGSPISERKRPETRDMLGLFLNTIPLLNTVKSDIDFSDFLYSVKNNFLSDIGNSEVQFDDLVKKLNIDRTSNIHPIFNVMLAMVDTNFQNLAFDDAIAENISYHNKTSKFDLLLEVHSFESEIKLYFEYSTEIFSEDTIGGLADGFMILVQDICENSTKQVGELKILNDLDRNKIIGFGYDHYNDLSSTETIISLFEKQVESTPNAVALVLNEEELTYDELNRNANKLARELENKIYRCQIVAILCSHSFEGIISMLAVQKAGGTYLPLDISYPKERIQNIILDSGCTLLLTNQESHQLLEYSCEIIRVNPGFHLGHAENNLAVKGRPDDAAYILYTSGTTGKPKGVVLKHKNTVNLILKTAPYFSVTNQDIFTMFHSYCFDVSVWEMYCALLNGAKLVIVPRVVAQDTKQLINLVMNKGITILCLPPSAFYLFLEEMTDASRLISLRFIILGGEAVKMYKLKAWYGYYPNVKLINGYGITETSVYSTYKEITQYEIDNNIGSIGHPLSTNYIYILDESKQICPIGVSGEMYIGGICLSGGYLNNEKLTNSKFIKDPLIQGQYMYQTGDLVRWMRNGEIKYISRKDHQIKVRGFRVETAEIEKTLAKFGAITEVVVIGIDDGSTTQIAAYFTSGQEENVFQIRTFLTNRLPGYMIPAYIVQLDEFILSTNGKVDRNKLPNPRAMHNTKTTKREASTPMQKLLRDIWADVLGISGDQISIDDKFFFIGGDSISASLVVRRLNNYSVDASIVDVFENDTIANFCEAVTEKEINDKLIQLDLVSPEIEQYWNDVNYVKVDYLPKENSNSNPGRAMATKKLDVPYRELMAVVNKQSNQVRLPELILTCIGMSLRMWTGGNIFRCTLLETSEKGVLKMQEPVLMTTCLPLIINLQNINDYEENVRHMILKFKEATLFKLELSIACKNQLFRNSLDNDVIFEYYHGVHDENSYEHRDMLIPFLENGSKFDDLIQDALYLRLTLLKDYAQLELHYSQNIYSEKAINLIRENFKFSLRQLVDYYTMRRDMVGNTDKIILEVEPFNEVFFRDCTYQALIPAIRHFDREFQLLFANCYSFYDIDSTSKNIRFLNRYILNKTDEQLFESLGLKIDKYFGSHDISDDIIKYLSIGAFVIVQVDCYYIERKKALYHKKHGAHSMLVYGFDKTDRMFFIIDNQAILSTNYQKNIIDFDELKAAYEGYNQHFNHLRNLVTLFVISNRPGLREDKSEKQSIASVAIKNLRMMRQKIIGTDILDIVLNNFIEIISSENLLLENVSQLNYIIGEIINSKRIELYKAETIIKDEKLSFILDRLIEDFEYIRNVLTKTELTRVYSYQSVLGMREKMKMVIQSEYDYLAKIEELSGPTKAYLN
jgi:tyrocidine synthetase-3